MQEQNDKRRISKFAQSALGAGSLVSRIASERGSQMITLASVDGGNKIDDEIFKNYEYPFTNLVFEGGGNKGMAYVGALEVCLFSFLMMNCFYLSYSYVQCF